ncbi:hypothetical protein COCMIDRAFT_31729 [Bipolaris oryzae ATCC 44560]|uniref:WSC domain-containing protein n=1 Tax=Bipolaris oryzae ATCC 44560 TaxID=930090 RepID=W6ZM79_COCMI|nr:uncharacterized protein COCMIDRAFT_31729 [Bipolaris oryzae ATCC 44560]EUC51170.1 hypothetical protein COCMIDRAFT_31729 [Bipolaris oryzae ATCC 44560]
MKTSQILFLSTLYASAHSYMAPKDVGSMPRNLGTPESMSRSHTPDSMDSARPSMECVDSTAKPSCDCTCTNGIRFNQTLSTDAPESPSCSTCEAEKEQYLVQLAINAGLATAREQQLKTDFENAAARETQLKTDLDAAALREQQLQIDFATASAHEQSLETDLEHALSREQQLKSHLDSASTREQHLTASLESKEEAHLATQRDLEAQLKPFKSPTFSIQKCYFTTTKRALTDFYIKDTEMTAYKCKHICRGSRFFGLSDGTSCYCGDVLSEELVEAGDAVCRVKCGGDGYACGGVGVTRVFRYEY